MATIKRTTQYVLAIRLPKQPVQIGKQTEQAYILKVLNGGDLQALLQSNDAKLDGAMVIESQNIHTMQIQTKVVLDLQDWVASPDAALGNGQKGELP